MADSYVQVAPDSSGKKIQTYENTVSAQTVEAQAVVLVDSTGVPITLPTIASTTNLLAGDNAGNAVASEISIPNETGVRNWIFRNDNISGSNITISNEDASATNVGISFDLGTAGAYYGDVFLDTGTYGLNLYCGTGGAYIYVNGSIRFSNDQGSHERARIGAGLMVGTTTDPGAGLINVLTGFRIGNAAAAGKILIGDGTNFVASTPTYPNASATSGKILKSDGTDFLASTETYAAPGTSGNVMKSDGTNWTSVAPPRYFSITVESPTASENIAFGFTTKALTITKVHAVVAGSTPSVTYNIGYGTSVGTLTDVTTTPSAVTNATTGADATLNNTSIPANGHLVFTTSAQSGTVTWIHVTVECA